MFQSEGPLPVARRSQNYDPHVWEKEELFNAELTRRRQVAPLQTIWSLDTL